MIKIYTDIYEFLKNDLKENISYNFTKNSYIVKVYDEINDLIVIKEEGGELFINGSVSLVEELVENMITLGLEFTECTMSKELAEIFTQKYVLNLGGSFIELECPIKGYKSFVYEEGNIKTCVLAGGCFWCVGKPYYEYNGVIRVFSGYSGGNKVMPSYEEVKSQSTHHRECIKLIYDENIITYEEILDIYFETIDPLDAEGQFIDRGESYTSALYYKTEKMKDYILQYIKKEEAKINKKFMVKLLPEEIFYMAEEYHQDYAVKNPELMEEELILSGRKNDL